MSRPVRATGTNDSPALPNETLIENRERALPAWAHRERFETFYCLSINTAPGTIPEGARIAHGDPVLPL